MMKWILVSMCHMVYGDLPVLCEPIAHFDTEQQCNKVQIDINKHDKKDHYYCIPEQPKEQKP